MKTIDTDKPILCHGSHPNLDLKAHWQVIGSRGHDMQLITKAITHSKELISGVMGRAEKVSGEEPGTKLLIASYHSFHDGRFKMDRLLLTGCIGGTLRGWGRE